MTHKIGAASTVPPLIVHRLESLRVPDFESFRHDFRTELHHGMMLSGLDVA
jgi:hypothetical protein